MSSPWQLLIFRQMETSSFLHALANRAKKLMCYRTCDRTGMNSEIMSMDKSYREKIPPPSYCVISFSGEISMSAKAFSRKLWLNLSCSFDKWEVCGKTQHLSIQVSCPWQKRVSCFGHPSLSSLPTLERLSHEEPITNPYLFSMLVILWMSLFKDRSPNLGQVWQRRGKKEKGWGVKDR